LAAQQFRHYCPSKRPATIARPTDPPPVLLSLPSPQPPPPVRDTSPLPQPTGSDIVGYMPLRQVRDAGHRGT
jgi:hypothetical protein